MSYKKIALFVAGLFATMIGLANTFAAEYVLSGADVTKLGGASTDTANSLFGSLSSLLPVFIPLIVIGFVIALVRSFINKRG